MFSPKAMLTPTYVVAKLIAKIKEIKLLVSIYKTNSSSYY